MTLPKLRKSPAISGAATLLVAAALMGAGAAQANAEPAHKETAARTSSTSFYLPYSGNSGLMPTWAWGSTTICVFNLGSSTGVAKLQAAAGINPPVYLYPEPFQQACRSEWWFGNPIHVTNVGSTPLVASGS